MSYEMIDQFLRNNLNDDDYAEYSTALDSICALPAPDVVMRDEQKPVVWMDAEGVIVGNNKDGTARPLYLHPAPDVDVESVAQSRGYALLGSGRYILNHSDDFHPELGAELIITFATEFDKQNRQIGEVRDNPDFQKPIEAKDMLIRIGFLNERGLYALENQLSLLRQCHFSDSVNHTTPAVMKQLVEALQSTEMFLDYIYNPKNKPTSFNLLMQQIIVVEQALAAAKEAGYELRTSE